MLTPIEEYKGIYLKRDDKHSEGQVNGGKLRQADFLISKFLAETPHNKHKAVVCSVSLKSPQSAIISTVCKKYGIPCNIITYKTSKPNINLSIAQENGAKIYGFKVGHSNVLEAYAKKYFPKDYFVNMGFESEDIFDANIEQAQNIPTGLDYLVIPVGSAMNFISIIKGLEKYNIKPKKIIGISVGRNPERVIKQYLNKNQLSNVTLIKSKFKYSEEVNIDNYFFDPIYEAKAYHWIINNLNLEKNNVLLWVVGKRNLEFKPQEINYLLL